VVELRTTFHHHLEAIQAKVTQLFALVEEDLAGATHALLSGDKDVLPLVTERERVSDTLYAETELLVNQQLALQAPVATDLRFLLSVLRIVPELERSHDLVVHIAEHADRVESEDLSPRTRGLVQRLGEVVADMWRQAAECWDQRDGAAGDALDERDDEVDGLHATLTAELASGQMGLQVAMDMTLVARFYERLGDHSVNIARRVTYLAGPAEES
jgi:phosphate transport system protein